MAQVLQKVKQTNAVTSMNKQQSKIFVKRMLAISISTITYMRNLFPEKAFSDRKLEDMNVKILSQSSHDGAATIINWMKGVYDALDNEFLQSMILAIVSDPLDPTSVLETYTFGFTYLNGEVQTNMKVERDDNKRTAPNIPSTEATKHSARKLVRNLIVLTHNMSALPKDVYMTVRLLYYDDRTPADYQPPGFVTAENKDVLNNVTDRIRIKIGNLDTPFYNVKLRANTPKDDYIEAGENSRQSSQVVPSESASNLSTDQLKDKLDEIVDQESTKSMSNIGLGVRCPCEGLTVEEPMILCTVCNFSQHAICFRIGENAIDNIKHICCWCSDQSGKTGTDSTLWELNDEGRRDLCLWRRTLKLCFSVSSGLTYGALCKKFKCTRGTAQKLVNKLQSQGIQKVVRNGARSTKEINLAILTKVYDKEINWQQPSENTIEDMSDAQPMEVDPVSEDSLFTHPAQVQKSSNSRAKRKLADDSGLGNSQSIYDFDGETEQVAIKKKKKVSKYEPNSSKENSYLF